MKILKKIVHFTQRFKDQIQSFPKHYRNFGLKMAIYIVIDRLFPPGRSKMYMNAVYRYLNENFSDITTKDYPECPEIIPKEKTLKDNKIVWVCWFQGEDAMPDLVKMCYNNLKSQIKDPTIKLFLLTYDNIDNYIDIPSYIREKHNNGNISNAHYSDIIRIKLLRQYGGCWIDSTIFVTSEIKSNLFEVDFFTMKMPAANCPKEPCLGLWSGFFLIAKKNLPLFCILEKCMEKYWRTHDEAIDYIFFDYLMLVAYRNNDIIRSVMDIVPYNNLHLWALWDNLERPYSEELLNEIYDNGQFYKLSYQKHLKKQLNNRETIYGYLSNHQRVDAKKLD